MLDYLVSLQINLLVSLFDLFVMETEMALFLISHFGFFCEYKWGQVTDSKNKNPSPVPIFLFYFYKIFDIIKGDV